MGTEWAVRPKSCLYARLLGHHRFEHPVESIAVVEVMVTNDYLPRPPAGRVVGFWIVLWC